MTIHANWTTRGLLLWQNEAAGDVASLRDRVGQVCADGLLASVAQTAQLHLRLPDSYAPQDAQAHQAHGPAVGFRERTIPAIQFSPAEAMDLLLSLPPCVPETCGDSVRYWQRLARFVSECIRAEKFFPAAHRANAHHEAHWRLHIGSPAELARLEQFARAMPPVCLAMAGETATALELLESFLRATTDALVRRAVSNDPFFTRLVAQAAAPDAGPEVRLLGALMGDSATIAGEARDNDVLVDQVQLWTSRLTGSAPTAGWQLEFSLIEPDTDVDPADRSWTVAFSLVPLGEGDAVPAEKIWTEASALSALGRQQAELRAVLSAELNRAAEVFPPLQRVINAPAPTELKLDTAEAQQFLRQWSAELKAKSFAVDLPAWADETERRMSLLMALHPDDEFTSRLQSGAASFPGAASMGLDSLLAFNWRVSLGGTELSPEEFEDLVRRQTPLVRLRGRWMQLDADAAAAAAEMLRKNPAGKTTLGEAFRAAFAARRDAASAPAIELTGTSWVRDLLEQLPAMRAAEVPQPREFHGELRPYQIRGLAWLAFLDQLGIGGCLADDMGLGKTIQLIALLLHERTSVQTGPTLLFAPTSVVGNWVRELERFSPQLRVLLHHGPQRLRNSAFVDAANKHDVVITSYALAHRDVEILTRVAWHRITLDEAQKIKNPSAASSTAIRSLSAPRRVALTGTPIENHLSELWSIMDVLNPGLLGSAREFRERFAVPIEKLLDRERSDHLRRMIRPFVLRRTKNDPQIAGDLPDKIEMKVFCNLTVEQAAMYERATAEMLSAIDSATGIRRRGLILAVLTRLKQICDHPALLDDQPHDEILDRRSGKCERLVEMLEEVIDEGESALVFTQYAQMGRLLQRLIGEKLRCPIFYLHGGTPQKQRDEMVRLFQQNAQPGVFILSLRAGGLGLNLTAASHVFHFDRWWNPAVENQATDRAHRIGQSRSVQVHKFIAVGTVEERIDKLLAEKTQLAEQIVGAGEEWLTELSTSDLKEYLRLSDQAVGEF